MLMHLQMTFLNLKFDIFMKLVCTKQSNQSCPEGKVHEKKSKKKLTSVSFMYVCVAENAELLVFF